MIIRMMFLCSIVVNGALLGSANSTPSFGSGGAPNVQAQDACMAPVAAKNPWEFKVGKNPQPVAFSPQGRFVAVANSSSNSVSVFEVDKNTGVLAEIKESPFVGVGARAVSSVAFSPNGRFMASVSSQDSSVVMFAVNEKIGTFKRVRGLPVKIGGRPHSIAFSPDNKLLVTSNWDHNTISVFTVNEISGKLQAAPGSPFSTVKNPTAVVFSLDSKFVIVAGFRDAVSVFSIDHATGSLSPAQKPEFEPQGGYESLSISRNGRLVAAPAILDNALSIDLF